MRLLFCVLLVGLLLSAGVPSATDLQPAFTFTGESSYDYFGWSVSNAGDVNNDGFGDIIVGAYYNDAGGNHAGRAYVYSGQSGNLLYAFTGEAEQDHLGKSVSCAGDVNNDGFDDLIMGAHYNDAGGDKAGRAYVYSGQNGTLLYTFTGGTEGDWFGYSVSGAGDVNNDGFDDVIVGARHDNAGGVEAGRAYVYSGQNGALLHTFTAEAEEDEFGYSVSGAGDANNDGFDDLIVAAKAFGAGVYDTGRAYVYSGQNGALLYTFTGEAAFDYLGESVSGAGDVNNDGFGDFIVGAPGYGTGLVEYGRAYVYSGQNGTLLHTFTGWADGDRFGYSVSGAGDVNNDGFDDLIVGTLYSDVGGQKVGRAYVYSGYSGTLLFTITNEATADNGFGRCVSGAGDVNNDGFDDLTVGAFGINDGGGYYAGWAYVYISGFICGDIDNSGGVDVADLTYLVDYLFGGGPPPPFMNAADIDDSGGIDVADLTYMVDYLFGGGSEPVCQ